MAGPFSELKFDQGLSRRDLFRRASAGIAGSLAGTLFSGSNRPAQAASTYSQRKSAPALTPESMPKAWSRGEIQRRWAKVRERMKESHLDCLLVPYRHIEGGSDPDVQYLTASGSPTPGQCANWVVFPYEGKVTALFPHLANPPAIEKYDDLGLELIAAKSEEEQLYSPLIIDCLRNLGMTHARIGVGSLVDVWRDWEGSVNYTTYDRILKAFPQAKFESAAELLMRVKLVKSLEEIAVLERATEVSEVGLQAMLQTARPGVLHRTVWMNVCRAMWEASGEFPSRYSLTAAGAPGLTSISGLPFDKALPSGEVMSQEIIGRVLGYVSEINQSVLIGSPAPADWVSAAHYSIDLFNASLDWIAPGKSYQEFFDFYGQKVKARGGKPGGVVLWNDGFGDGPRAGPGGRKEGLNDIFEAGQVLDLKPIISIRQTKATAQFGDAVVVTEKGARRLGKRKMELITLGA